MTKLLTINFSVLLTFTYSLEAVELDYYLSSSVRYDKTITTPKDYLGFEIGQRHLQHHQLVGYLQTIAQQSDRITIEEYGRTHGDRPLMVLMITSQRNHQQLEDIRRAQMQLADPQRAGDVETKSLPAVIWMGYNVHGNEASAGNVAPLVAYHLAAARGKEMEDLLRETVVLLDPCLNPDGLERFALWVNDHKGRSVNPDPEHREHNELFPSGRTNYYWFDLNRDWLPAQHPESQGRLAVYHRWLPNVVLDFHEMSSNATYFFQPGIPARNNPLTPQRNFRLTRQIAEYHAKALDRVGSLYFTEERYDDFYMGKGSTYPDLHGGIGILFEQGSARGHAQTTANGLLTFPFAIRNQLLTSLSSLEATRDSRMQLLDYKREFYRDAVSLARDAKVRAYIFSAGSDEVRADRFLAILRRHAIQAYQLGRDLTIGKQTFAREQSFVVPVDQPEYRFLTSLFETRTEFEENIFYDVSTWTVPLAFDLDFAQWTQPLADDLFGDALVGTQRPTPSTVLQDDDYAYLLDWRDYFAPRSLYRLLDAEIQVKAAHSPFGVDVSGETSNFGYGTILVPLGIQPEKRDQIRQLVTTIADEDRVDVVPAKTGLTPTGIDLGSSDFTNLKKPAILLVVGVGTSAYETGEIWHLLDHRFHIPVTLVDTHRLSSVDLENYNTMVIASGTYQLVSPAAVERIKTWLRRGGTLIAIGSAVRWVSSSDIAQIEFRSRQEPAAPAAEHAATPRRPYAAAANDAALRQVEGTIFRTQVDVTHPVCFGLERQNLPVFRNQSFFLEPSKNAYSTPVLYESEPLVSGYISDENLQLIAGSASVLVQGVGAGRVILMADNPNFRAYWYGTHRLFLNSVFFGQNIKEP